MQEKRNLFHFPRPIGVSGDDAANVMEEKSQTVTVNELDKKVVECR